MRPLTTIRRRIARLLWDAAFKVSPDRPVEITMLRKHQIVGDDDWRRVWSITMPQPEP